MLLRLPFPPAPEHAPRHAEVAVSAARDISQVDLNYSIDSLQQVDAIIEEMRTEGVTEDQVAETLFSFGCYVGEVFVRHANGKWVDTEATRMRGLAGFPIVIELGPENCCNPIGKVFKRLLNGPEDSLPYFFQVFSKS